MVSGAGKPVTLVTSEIIHPPNPTWSGLPSSLPFGPLDTLVTPFIPIAVVFVYAPTASHSQPISLSRLRRALAVLLEHYPNLTGRLSINTNDGTRSIDRLGSGAELFSASCAQPLLAWSREDGITARVLLQDLPEGGNALLPPFEGTMESILVDPIFTVQHTRFTDGAAALGVRLLHTVTDAEGFFQVMADLADIYRQMELNERGNKDGLVSITKTPHYGSYYSDLILTEEEKAEALLYRPEMYHTGPTPADGSAPTPDLANTTDLSSFPPPPSTVTGRLVHMTSEKLASLKSQAVAHPVGAGSPAQESPLTFQDPFISTFTALSAYIYLRVTLARQHLHSQGNHGPLSPPDFLTPINIRRHLPSLPTKYFPNALLTTYTTVSPSTFSLPGALPIIARRIHAATHLPSLTSSEPIDKTLRWMAVQTDKTPGAIKQGFRFGNGSFMISQWNKVKAIYEPFEVGGEPPVLVSPPFTSISLVDGLAYILPTRNEHGLDVLLSLSEDVWQVLDREGGL